MATRGSNVEGKYQDVIEDFTKKVGLEVLYRNGLKSDTRATFCVSDDAMNSLSKQTRDGYDFGVKEEVTDAYFNGDWYDSEEDVFLEGYLDVDFSLSEEANKEKLKEESDRIVGYIINLMGDSTEHILTDLGEIKGKLESSAEEYTTYLLRNAYKVREVLESKVEDMEFIQNNDFSNINRQLKRLGYVTRKEKDKIHVGNFEIKQEEESKLRYGLTDSEEVIWEKQPIKLKVKEKESDGKITNFTKAELESDLNSIVGKLG